MPGTSTDCGVFGTNCARNWAPSAISDRVHWSRSPASAQTDCMRRRDPGPPQRALSRSVGGKRVNRGIPEDGLDETRAQIAEHERFKDLSRRLVEASEDLCRARLKAGRDAGRGAQKGGSAVR